MDYVKSCGWEIGMVIEHCEWVEGMEIRYQISDIGVGMGSNSISPLRPSPQGHKVTCHGVDDCWGLMCHMRMSHEVT